jgi:hypothetical protein
LGIDAVGLNGNHRMTHPRGDLGWAGEAVQRGKKMRTDKKKATRLHHQQDAGLETRANSVVTLESLSASQVASRDFEIIAE